MEKIVDFLKKNKKMIFTLAIFVLLITVGNTVFAKINSASAELKSEEYFFRDLLGDNFFTETLDGIAGTVKDATRYVADSLVKAVGQVAAGSLMKILNFFALAAAAVFFLALYAIWGLFGGSIFDMPWPDKIVFNEMAMFDPNFINPTKTSELYSDIQATHLMGYMQSAITTVYFSFFVIAMAIMVISAMVLGIKLAMTSIASQKAQYKEMINKWVVGVVLLFSLHFIMAGAFAINEAICEICSKAAAKVTIKFDITQMNAVTKAGSVLKSIFNGVKGLLSGEGFSGFGKNSIILKFKGYNGIMWYLLLNAGFNSDLIASMTLLAILGQTINLIFHYLKRFFYIIFLAMIGPMIVAVDVIKRV